MSTIDGDTPSASAPAAPKPNSFQRMAGVIMAPVDTFASIARRPDWVVPLILWVLLALAGGILVATKVDFTALAREAVEMNPSSAQMPADRMDSAIKFTAAIMKVSTYAGPLVLAFVFAVIAVVLMVSFRLFAGEITFLQAFSVTLYAWVPRVIKQIIGVIVIYSRSTVSMLDLQNPVMSNLGFLSDPKTNPVLYAIASSVDIFAIWSVILMIVGFAVASRLSRGKSATIVISWWIVVNLLALIGPAMQMMRR